MQYVGDSGVLACYYAALTGCLPEIAFKAMETKNIPKDIRVMVMKDVLNCLPDVEIIEQARLCGLRGSTFREYRSRFLKEEIV